MVLSHLSLRLFDRDPVCQGAWLRVMLRRSRFPRAASTFLGGCVTE